MEKKLFVTLLYCLVIMISNLVISGCCKANNEVITVNYTNSYIELNYIPYSASDHESIITLVADKISGRYMVYSSPEYSISIDYSMQIGNGDGITLCNEADFCLSGTVLRKSLNQLDLFVLSPLKGRLVVDKDNNILVKTENYNHLSDVGSVDRWIELSIIDTSHFKDNAPEITPIFAVAGVQVEYSSINFGTVRVPINISIVPLGK